MANAGTGQLGSVLRADSDSSPKNDPIKDALAEARDAAREQLLAAWQIEADRIQEQLAARGRGHLEHIFEERFAELTARLQEEFRRTVDHRLDAAASEAAVRARRDVSERLNQAARRLRAFENEDEWGRALVDSTETFCGRSALFTVHGNALRLRVSRGLPPGVRIDNTPLESAPGFASAVESRDTIVALCGPGELSGAISEVLGEASQQRCYLFPVNAHDRVAAVLYADQGAAHDPICACEVDSSALELLAAIASAVLDAQHTAPEAAKLVQIGQEVQPSPTVSAWFSLSKEDQELHLRAQRFARVQVAEMRLYQSQPVKEGRLQRNLYEALREPIDRSREAFRTDHLTTSTTMVDYLHLELLRTLANDDVELLGPEYPGPMA